MELLEAEESEAQDPVVAKQEEDGHQGPGHPAALPQVADLLLERFLPRGHAAVVDHLSSRGHVAPERKSQFDIYDGM